MTKTFMQSVDLDQLLAIAEQKGCACNSIFEGPCLAHFAQQQREAGSASRPLTKSTPQQQEEFYAQPDRRSGTANPASGKQRPDPGVRRDDRGDGNRSAKPVRNGSGRKR